MWRLDCIRKKPNEAFGQDVLHWLVNGMRPKARYKTVQIICAGLIARFGCRRSRQIVPRVPAFRSGHRQWGRLS